MNKKNIFGALALATVAAFAMTSCDKSKCQVDEKKVESKQAVPSDAKIAYVEVDSIMSQYKFCKDYSLILQKKGQNIQNTLAQKQHALEQAYGNFQQKVQQNAYTRAGRADSDVAAEAEQRPSGAQPASERRVPGRDREV